MRSSVQALLLFTLVEVGWTSACAPVGSSARGARHPDAVSSEPRPEEPRREPGARSGGSGDAQARRVSLTDEREPDPRRALPRVSTRHIGMHIGGESNSPEAKAPFLAALEQAELDYLLCYRLVERPMKGGTFGTDLYVGTRGGAPEVRAIRQRLGGEDFERCMGEALSRVDFPDLSRPTVLSYSLRFDVEVP